MGQLRSRLLVEGLHTCANCHSFSRDGKTFGIEMDGPERERKYAFTPLAPLTVIRKEEVITRTGLPPGSGQKTLALMPHLSPDDRYAVATVNEAVYAANDKDYRFLQLFYPTRGILAVHSRATGADRGADRRRRPAFRTDQRCVEPPGRLPGLSPCSHARDPYPEGLKFAEYADDTNEVPIRYDLYRIPFDGGRGGPRKRSAARRAMA